MSAGDTDADCTTGLSLSTDSEDLEDPDFSQMIQSSIDSRRYLFPELQFQCETDIKGIRGYFLVDSNQSTSLYFEIWRKQEDSRSYIRIQQVYFNLSTHCKGDNEECYIDYLLPQEVEAEIGDFIGFYTDNDTLARPLFLSSTLNTQLFLFPSRNLPVLFIIDRVFDRVLNLSIPYRPQVNGKYTICIGNRMDLRAIKE